MPKYDMLECGRCNFVDELNKRQDWKPIWETYRQYVVYCGEGKEEYVSVVLQKDGDYARLG